MVSLARVRLDPRKSVRPFKGIFCDDISEFESSHPSQAVGSLPTNRMSLKTARHRVPALRGSATDGACHGRIVQIILRDEVSARSAMTATRRRARSAMKAGRRMDAAVCRAEVCYPF